MRGANTLAGLLHKRASDGAIDYEEFIRLARTLGGAPEAAECFRRAVFNLLSTNRDDHGRNHAFLYDEKERRWTLAPAYDLNPNVANVLIGLSWLGSTRIPTTREELLRLAEVGGVPDKQARAIYEQVEEAVLGGWPKHAAEARAPTPTISYWEREMLNQTSALRHSMRNSAG
jgi:serine/threonine-protein kinase HipA